MKVLIACEFSAVVRDAFRALGHDAFSCDLLPSEVPSSFHFQRDLRSFPPSFFSFFDLMIAHPPCTHLSVSGARWFAEKESEQREALSFVSFLLSVPISRIALENPKSIISGKIRKPDQVIQPWQFGHWETKMTCLWLKNLPHLQPTEIVPGLRNSVHWAPDSKERGKKRSRTYTGIAKAMAQQWSFS